VDSNGQCAHTAYAPWLGDCPSCINYHDSDNNAFNNSTAPQTTTNNYYGNNYTFNGTSTPSSGPTVNNYYGNNYTFNGTSTPSSGPTINNYYGDNYTFNGDNNDIQSGDRNIQINWDNVLQETIDGAIDGVISAYIIVGVAALVPGVGQVSAGTTLIVELSVGAAVGFVSSLRSELKKNS